MASAVSRGGRTPDAASCADDVDLPLGEAFGERRIVVDALEEFVVDGDLLLDGREIVFQELLS